MHSILLNIENAVEYNFVQTLLTRVGFNILAIRKGADMKNILENNFPEVVITSRMGREQNTLHELMKIKESRGVPKFIWLGAPSQFNKLNHDQKEMIDGMVSTPIQPERLIETICQMIGVDVGHFKDRYRDLYKKEVGTKYRLELSDEKKRSYDNFLQNTEKQEDTLDVKSLSRASKGRGEANTEDLLQLKKEFVKKLIK